MSLPLQHICPEILKTDFFVFGLFAAAFYLFLMKFLQNSILYIFFCLFQFQVYLLLKLNNLLMKKDKNSAAEYFVFGILNLRGYP